jgi:hypothetical protein
MGMSHRALLLTVALAAGTLACSDPTGQPALEPCPGDSVTLEAGSGVTPLFTWSPDCGVAFLEVYPAAGGGSRWTVYADSSSAAENPIRTGVRYGMTPRHGVTVAGPLPLAPGTAYTIGVSRLLCDQGLLCTLAAAGHVTFQP